MKQLGYIGIDQCGTHYIIQKHPRKELLKQLGRKFAQKMYVDDKEGNPKHIGYIIAGLWIRIYRVFPFKEG